MKRYIFNTIHNDSEKRGQPKNKYFRKIGSLDTAQAELTNTLVNNLQNHAQSENTTLSTKSIVNLLTESAEQTILALSENEASSQEYQFITSQLLQYIYAAILNIFKSSLIAPSLAEVIDAEQASLYIQYIISFVKTCAKDYPVLNEMQRQIIINRLKFTSDDSAAATKLKVASYNAEIEQLHEVLRQELHTMLTGRIIEFEKFLINLTHVPAIATRFIEKIEANTQQVPAASVINSTDNWLIAKFNIARNVVFGTGEIAKNYIELMKLNEHAGIIILESLLWLPEKITELENKFTVISQYFTPDAISLVTEYLTIVKSCINTPAHSLWYHQSNKINNLRQQNNKNKDEIIKLKQQYQDLLQNFESLKQDNLKIVSLNSELSKQFKIDDTLQNNVQTSINTDDTYSLALEENTQVAKADVAVIGADYQAIF